MDRLFKSLSVQSWTADYTRLPLFQNETPFVSFVIHILAYHPTPLLKHQNKEGIMFGTYNVFSIFSRIRLHNDYYISDNDSLPNLNNSLSTADAPGAPDNSAAVKSLPAAETTPTDTIKLSNTNATAPKTTTLATYTPETVKTAADEAAPTDEGQPADEPQSQNQLVKTKSMAKLNLKMAFNLSDFQSLVSAVADDAQDGKLDSISYSNLNLGLHADLDAKAFIKETYKVAEGQDGTVATPNYKEKAMYNNLEASLVKSRGFEAASFYRESLNTNFRIRQTYRDGFLQVARKLSMRYSQDFGLNMRTMNLFNSQAETLDQTGELQSYLGSTEALVDSPQASGDLIGQFFDTVGTYLDGAEDKLIEKINTFFDNLASEMGIDSSLLSGAKESLVSNITDFFDRVDQAIGSVQTSYIPQQPQPETIEPPQDTGLDPEPELVETSEALAET